MGKKKLKLTLSIARDFAIGGFILWLIETVAFLIIEGWHWKATHPVEIYLDECVSRMWRMALDLTIFAAVVHILTSKKKKKDEQVE